MTKPVYCPYCKADLRKEGIGETFEYHRVMLPDGAEGDGEVGDFVEYFCPACGKTISEEQYSEVFGRE